jgi:23S rRNA pseudouridine1911/1915/1917 synthase
LAIRSPVSSSRAPALEAPWDDDGGDAADAVDEAVLDGAHQDATHPVDTFLADATDHGERIDKALARRFADHSRSYLRGLIDAGHVRVDGEPSTAASRRLRAGQAVDVRRVPTPESLAFEPEPMALEIVHEDAELMVLNKPVGLVVHPAAGHWHGTLLNGVLAHHPAAASLPRAGIVHRLDKDTSGLMVLAKTLEAATFLTRAIAAREIKREYLAIAHGALTLDEQSIDAPIGRDLVSRVRMAVRADGKPARTDVQVLARSNAFSALRCRLHTGRTHQIRVHLRSLGHPLVADAVYGGAAALGLERQALHAALLELRHPRRSSLLRFEIPVPPDMAQAWEQVVADAPGIVRGRG